MKKLLIAVLFTLSTAFAYSQFSFTYNGREYHVLKTSKFKDVAGKEYDYKGMQLYMMGGEHEILPANPKDASKGFLMSPISKEEQLKRVMGAPKELSEMYKDTNMAAPKRTAIVNLDFDKEAWN